jgi:hypothetical protein
VLAFTKDTAGSARIGGVRLNSIMPHVLLANLVRLAAFQHTMGSGAQGNLILPVQLDVSCWRPAGSNSKGVIFTIRLTAEFVHMLLLLSLQYVLCC